MRYAFADCVLDTDSLSLQRNGVAVALEPQVFDLILLLVRNADRVVTKDEIVDGVWHGRIVSESAVSARVAAARKAVGDDGQRQAVIRTVPRRGLQMVAAVTPDAPPMHEAAPSPPHPAPHLRYTRNAEGHSIAWCSVGDGPPVMRIGAPLVGIARQWSLPTERVLIDALSARHRLVHYDCSGFGLSSPTPEGIPLSRIADDVIAVADAAGIDRFAVISESGSSLIAIRAAAKYPDRLSRLVLVGGYVDGRVRRAPGPVADPIRELIREGWQTSGGGLALAFQYSYYPEGPHDVVRDIARLEQAAMTETQALRMRDLVNADSVADLLHKVTCPTLIVQGRDNAVHPLSEAHKLASGIPNAELVVLDTANHVPMPGNSVWDDYLAKLLAFLDTPDAP